jgi:predicted SnoaL-like aldol condensation-catalyzing enzyme
MTDGTEANRVIVEDFARLFYTERDVPSAFGRYVATDYIQHNPGAENGRDPAIAFLTPMFSAEGARFEIQRIVVDGDLAAIHVRAQPPGRPLLAVADFYRLAGGLIVEHWDVLQPVPESTASGNGMF